MDSNVLATVMTKKGICLNILINSRDFIISFLPNGKHTNERTPDLKETKSIKSRNKSIDCECVDLILSQRL